MIIRPSTPMDFEAIETLHLAAFGAGENQTVARLAVELARDAPPALSLIAEDGGEVVGHCVFSPAGITNHGAIRGYILAPLAVRPARQRRGIGRQLIAHGLDQLAQQGVDAVFVLGDPAYYQRSGFHTRHRVQAPYPLAYPEAWQAVALRTGALDGIAGTLHCVPALMAPALW